MKKRLVLFITTCVLACSLCTGVALAAESDGAGNYYGSEEAQTLSDAAFSNDYFWAGRTLDLRNTSIDGSAIIAGQDLALRAVTAKGSLRIAGQNVVVADSVFDHNITAAAYSINIYAGTKARGTYLAASDVTYAGTSDYLVVSAEKVLINGVVNGDVSIDAKEVTIDDNAVITGTLKITADAVPTISSTAQIGDLQFTQNTVDEEEEVASETALVGLFAGFTVARFIICLISFVLIALLIHWLGRKPLEEAGMMLKKRPVPLLVSGLIAVVAFPLAFVILCCLIATWRIAVVLLLIVGMIGVICAPFAGASLGRLIFKKMNPLLAALLGAACMAVLTVIPIVTFFVSLFSTLYVTGYVIQWLYLNRLKKKPQQPAPAAPAPTLGESVPVSAAAPRAGTTGDTEH